MVDIILAKLMVGDNILYRIYNVKEDKVIVYMESQLMKRLKLGYEVYGLQYNKKIGVIDKIGVFNKVSCIKDGINVNGNALTILDSENLGNDCIYTVIDMNGSITSMNHSELSKYNVVNFGDVNDEGLYTKGLFSLLKGNRTGASVENRQSYIGDENGPGLSKTIVTSILDGSNTHKVINYIDGELRYSDCSYKIIDIERNKLKVTDKVCEGHNFISVRALVKTVNQYKDVKSIDDELCRVIRCKEFKNKYNKLLKEFNRRRGEYSDYKIGNIVIKCNIYDDKNLNDISIEELKDIVNNLRKMSCRIRTVIRLEDTIVLLNRVCIKRGIKYNAFDASKGRIISVELEDVWNNIGNYYNAVKESNNKLRVVGLDASYTYDMDKMNEVYQNRIIENNRSKRAMLIGDKYVEKINERGELLHLETNMSRMVIPKEVKSINLGAIKYHSGITEIIVNKGLEKASKGIMTNRDIENRKLNLERIEINTESYKGTTDFLEGVSNYFYSNNNLNITVSFNRNIHYKEFGVLLFSKYFRLDDESIKYIDTDIDYLVKAFDYGISKGMGKLEKIKDKKNIYEIKSRFREIENRLNRFNSKSKDLILSLYGEDKYKEIEKRIQYVSETIRSW